MTSSNTASTLDRIRARQARVGVIGLGYVGLPLAVEFARAGFDVTGFDVDETKPNKINGGTSYLSDVSSADLRALVARGVLRATTDKRQLPPVDVIEICVPTPIR